MHTYIHPPVEASPIAALDAKPTLLELELENARLHALVADLLVRNQQLRLQLKARALTL